MGQKDLGLCSKANNPHGCFITFDSGSTWPIFPKYTNKLLESHKIPSAVNPQACNQTAQFGNLDFIINGKTYSVSAS